MTRGHQLFAVTLLLAGTGCDPSGPAGPTVHTLLVQHFKVECVGMAVQRCLLVQEPGAAAFGVMYHGVEGLQYEWGTTYELEVEEHQVANPPPDGSSIRTVLRRVISSTRVPAGTEFNLVLTARPELVTEVAPGRYRFTLGPDFTCDPTVSCSALLAAFAPGRKIHFHFAHPAAQGDALVVRAWTLCGPTQAVFVCEPAS